MKSFWALWRSGHPRRRDTHGPRDPWIAAGRQAGRRPCASCIDHGLTGMGAEKADQGRVLFSIVASGDDMIVELRRSNPVTTVSAELQIQLLGDVSAHGRRGRCRQRHGRGEPRRVSDSADAPVARPKIVPPLADTVGLIDGEQGHAGRAEAITGRASSNRSGAT